MSRAAAVVLTYGRTLLGELLAQLECQTRPLPVLVWVDDTPDLVVHAPPLVHVVHGAREGRDRSIGLVRRAAVEAARARFELGADDAIVLLDDDDFYCAHHFARTLQALEGAVWTGGLAMGLVLGDGPPEYVRAERGLGQHATWAMRMAHYDRAGGYIDERSEDTGLAERLGWHTCAPHFACTHVRRHHVANLSGIAQYDRGAMRLIDDTAKVIEPRWSPRCEEFERFCADHLDRASL